MAEIYKRVSNPITGTVFYQNLVLSSGMGKIMIQIGKNFHNHIEIVCLTHPNICLYRCHEKFGRTLWHLTHWGRAVMHICVGNLTIIGPDNGLSPGRRQPIIWTNAGMLFTGPLGTNFSEILIEILTFSF